MGKRKAVTQSDQSQAAQPKGQETHGFVPSDYPTKAARVRAYDKLYPGKKHSEIARTLTSMTGETYAQTQVRAALLGNKASGASRAAEDAPKRGRPAGSTNQPKAQQTQSRASGGIDIDAIRLARQLIGRVGPDAAKQLIDAMA